MNDTNRLPTVEEYLAEIERGDGVVNSTICNTKTRRHAGFLRIYKKKVEIFSVVA